MNYDILNKLVNESKSLNEIAHELNLSQTNVRYWLKKHKLETNCKWKLEDKSSKHCPRCNSDKAIGEFYQRRGQLGGSVYCKTCTGEQAIERMRQFKSDCVEYKGGKCIRCEYNKCIDALEFHHRDPSKKEFTISQIKGKSLDSKVKKELDKCDILCSNCHREKHFDLRR